MKNNGQRNQPRRIRKVKHSKDPRRHVFRYDEHVPHTDDISLVVLKGHLLVEEMLNELARNVFPNAGYLDDACLSFHQLPRVVRSAVRAKHKDSCWDLILALNSLRNDLVHNLEPPKLKNRVQALIDIAATAQPIRPDLIDKSQCHKLDQDERVQQAVVDCMQFLRTLIFASEVVKTRKAAPSRRSQTKRPR
jgi:hypothetical protein